MNMVEKMARAMVPVLGFSPDCDWERVWVGNQMDSPETGSLAYMCRGLARAALAAAMEPTPGMVEAAKQVPCDDVVFGGVVYSTSAEARAIWQAMCRAALDEGEG